MSNETIMTRINTALKHEVASRHSYFQLRYFLIGKEPTNQAKMWQCLRELKTRTESLSSLDLEIEETKDKLKLLDITKTELLESLNNATIDQGLQAARIEIKIRQNSRQKTSAEASLASLIERKKWIEEESRFFIETFENIQKIETLKPFDDFESQKQYWQEKLSQKINLKMLMNNQIDHELLETIVALPDDIPIKKQTLVALNERHQQLLESIKNKG